MTGSFMDPDGYYGTPWDMPPITNQPWLGEPLDGQYWEGPNKRPATDLRAERARARASARWGAGLTTGTTSMGTWDWVLDSGATHHMTPHKEYLFDLQPVTNGGTVSASGDTKHHLQVKGIGKIRFLSTVNGVEHTREIHGVWYVPGLRVSLLSTQALKRAGCWVTQW